ncbi:energy-coupling factor transporter ATP-binding protein EcfA2 [Pseudarthrobacter defluvii]|uniref:ABC transporter ATP-binding protein n=1 Tax=Pseudarthrobacter defluvii TaxID=410837 RepID=UPI002780987F|nr:ATP-binding cassette domain-containing protein [Pseudarthrobacter defluvii]MDQ0769623.1 energy-coupling factor transporter ATP-binding protein EcfA2 [Pseudarthrobacter defluvii]
MLAAGIRRFTFHDGHAPALHDLAVSFPPGSFTAVLGASGSGKSTLGRLLAGWLPPGGYGTLSGFLELDGTRLEFDGGQGDPRINPAGWGRQVGFVPQDPATVLSTVRATVAEELAFGLENAGVERGNMVAAVERTAGLLGLASLLDQDPARLSGGQQRRLAIGCAIIAGPPVLVMDEPFASLDAAGIKELAALVRDLLKRGTAVVILSQTVDPLLQEADTWVVLSDGTATASGPPAGLDTGSLPPAIRRPGSLPAGTPPLGTPPPPQAAAVEPGPPALQLQGVSFGYAVPARGRKRRKAAAQDARTLVLEDINLAVQPGEIVAVTGPNGAGKSTFLRHLNGLLRPTSGSVAVRGTDIAGAPVGTTAASVGLLFQQPRDQLFERTVLREVGFGLDRLVGPATAKERAAAALAAVGLAGAADDHPAELPASAQRLLALATVLARRPVVLALDEPTVALDGDGLALLDAAVRSAAAEGAAVVLVTHDLGYARSAAHRILALDGGRLVPA